MFFETITQHCSKLAYRDRIIYYTVAMDGELRAARNATHNFRTGLKNFSSNNRVNLRSLQLIDKKNIFVETNKLQLL